MATDRQTDKQMDIIDAWSRSFAIASCGLTRRGHVKIFRSTTNTDQRSTSLSRCR